MCYQINQTSPKQPEPNTLFIFGSKLYNKVEPEDKAFFEKLSDEIDSMIEKVYQGKTILLWEPLFKKVASRLNDALNIGLSKVGKSKLERAFTKELQTNIFTFAAFKSHAEVKDIASLLTKEGKLVPFQDFKAQALQISKNYNQHWLATEYNVAVGNAQTAAKFYDAMATKDQYPLLQYVTQNDERVRDEHAAWEGVILPVEHPFWNTNTPMNGWGCRCTIKKLKEGEITKNIPKLEIQSSEFNFNPAISRQIFPMEEGYFKGVTDTEKRRILEYVKSVDIPPLR